MVVLRGRSERIIMRTWGIRYCIEHVVEMRVDIEMRLRGFYFAQMVAPATDDAEEDEESMDWWTKYFASIDTMIEVSSSIRGFSIPSAVLSSLREV